MKECKHKNIVAYFGSYHRCWVFSDVWNSSDCWWTEICGIWLLSCTRCCWIPLPLLQLLSYIVGPPAHAWYCALVGVNALASLYEGLSASFLNAVLVFNQCLHSCSATEEQRACQTCQIKAECLSLETPSCGSAWSTAVEAPCRISTMVKTHTSKIHVRTRRIYCPRSAEFTAMTSVMSMSMWLN